MSKRRRAHVGITIFVVAVFFLALGIVLVESDRAEVSERLQALRARHQQLLKQQNEIDGYQSEVRRHQSMVFGTFRQCRRPEDIPRLDGEHVYTLLKNGDPYQLVFHVPAGQHRLKVRARWVVQAKAAAGVFRIPENTPDDFWTDVQTWEVELLPSSGYLMKMQTKRGGGEVSWNLASNNPDFAAESRNVPIDDFRHRGSSWSGNQRKCFLPNTIPISKLDADVSETRLKRLMLSGALGPDENQQVRLEFSVSLQSDGPPQVAARQAATLFLRGEGHVLRPYSGNGKYELWRDDSSE